MLAASHVRAQSPRERSLLEQGKTDWFAMRTKSAEQKLTAATKVPATAAEAHYWLGRIYDFKGNRAEGAFPGFHEEIAYRQRAEAEFKAAGEPKPEWVLEATGLENSLKAADAAIAKLQADPKSSALAIRHAIDVRVKLRPDPLSYIAGANLLLSREADLPYVLRLAAEGRAAGDRFIWENESSYKLDGKVRGSLDRNAAVFADIAGWALFLQNDLAGAEKRLAEAARLYRNVDATNQLHLAELSKRKNDLENAREHYVSALGLAGITPQQRDQAKASLADVQATNGEDPAEFEKWLTTTLDRKREERRKALVSNMAGRRVPALVLKDLQSNDVDLRAERGNVVLLNFFSAW